MRQSSATGWLAGWLAVAGWLAGWLLSELRYTVAMFWSCPVGTLAMALLLPPSWAQEQLSPFPNATAGTFFSGVFSDGMVLQRGPELPKWSPECSRGSKMAPQNVQMEAPSSPNGNPKKPNGAGGGGKSP